MIWNGLMAGGFFDPEWKTPLSTCLFVDWVGDSSYGLAATIVSRAFDSQEYPFDRFQQRGTADQSGFVVSPWRHRPGCAFDQAVQGGLEFCR
jgi:hypothetical protein